MERTIYMLDISCSLIKRKSYFANIAGPIKESLRLRQHSK
jgi:hypothetical protein